MIAVVIAIVVVLNLIAGQLPENIRNIDISDNKIYEISDVSKDMLADLDKDVTFTVFAEKKSTDERIKTFLGKYGSLSGNISIEWIDPVQHPSALTENDVDSDTILISCEDTGKSTTVAFSDILVVDEYSYYLTGQTTESEFDGEGQLTSAVNYVISDESGNIYYTTGHGEATFSTSVYELLGKNNMEASELNMIMGDAIPDDCDLLFLYAPTSDITEEEKDDILDYMSAGGNVFVMLGEMDDEAPNLDEILNEYGIQRVDGYIADMERCYQGNYYYIFPNTTATGDMATGLSTDMILLINAHGLTLTDPARDTISVDDFMSTSSNAYAVTEDTQEQGTYVLGAVATESITLDADNADDADDVEEDTSDDADDDADESDDTESTTETVESRLTVISAESMIDSQVTSAFSSLENLTLFMNAVSCNFDGVQNLAIEAKSLEITYNTMRYAGPISLLIIFGIPAIILIYGFSRWWKRRKA
jgi:ABC-2 type transport system permease protein